MSIWSQSNVWYISLLHDEAIHQCKLPWVNPWDNTYWGLVNNLGGEVITLRVTYRPDRLVIDCCFAPITFVDHSVLQIVLFGWYPAWRSSKSPCYGEVKPWQFCRTWTLHWDHGHVLIAIYYSSSAHLSDDEVTDMISDRCQMLTLHDQSYDSMWWSCDHYCPQISVDIY